MDAKKLIQEVLKKTPLTFETLSRELGVTPSFLKALENNEKPLSSHYEKKLKQCLLDHKSVDSNEQTTQEISEDEDLIIRFLNDEETVVEKTFLTDEDNEG